MIKLFIMDLVDNRKTQGRINRSAHCGVPQCNNYRSNDIYMYHIPLHVKKSPMLLKKWLIILKMGKKFPNQFLICSRHFKEEDILIPVRAENKRFKTKLAHRAFPSRNLPVSVIPSRPTIPRSTRLNYNLQEMLVY